MLKSIGMMAAAAVFAAVSFVQPPSASAREWSNRGSNAYSASEQNRDEYGNYTAGQDRDNFNGRNSAVTNRDTYTNSSDRGSSGFDRGNQKFTDRESGSTNEHRLSSHIGSRSGQQDFRNVRDEGHDPDYR